MGQRKRIHERGVDPPQQLGIVRRKRRARPERAGRLWQSAMHAVVNRVDAPGRMLDLACGAKRQREHRLYCLEQPAMS